MLFKSTFRTISTSLFCTRPLFLSRSRIGTSIRSYSDIKRIAFISITKCIPFTIHCELQKVAPNKGESYTATNTNGLNCLKSSTLRQYHVVLPSEQFCDAEIDDQDMEDGINNSDDDDGSARRVQVAMTAGPHHRTSTKEGYAYDTNNKLFYDEDYDEYYLHMTRSETKPATKYDNDSLLGDEILQHDDVSDVEESDIHQIWDAFDNPNIIFSSSSSSYYNCSNGSSNAAEDETDYRELEEDYEIMHDDLESIIDAEVER